MKVEENFFSGFPVVWNMLVFTLFVIKASELVAFGIVLLAVVMTFLPINFLHPVRVARLRPINLTVFAIWSVLSGYALLLHFHSPDWLMWAVMLTSAYLFVNRRDHADVSKSGPAIIGLNQEMAVISKKGLEHEGDCCFHPWRTRSS
jgi:phosphatidylserine synthase